MQTIEVVFALELADSTVAALAELDRAGAADKVEKSFSDNLRARSFIQRMVANLVGKSVEAIGAAYLAGYKDGRPWTDQGEADDQELESGPSSQ